MTYNSLKAESVEHVQFGDPTTPYPWGAADGSHGGAAPAAPGPPALDTALLFRVAENAPVAIAVVEGTQHRFIYANGLYRKLNPAHDIDIIGRPLAEVFPDVSHQAVALINQIYATGRAIKLRGHVSNAISDRPNSVWNIDLVPLAAANRKVQAVMLMLQDITSLVEARAHADERAREAEESGRMLDGHPGTIFVAVHNATLVMEIGNEGPRYHGTAREDRTS